MERYRPTKEHTDKIVATRIKNGTYPHTEETKLKISESGKGRVPWNKFMKGLHVMSEETRKKMSEAHKGERAWSWAGGKWPYKKRQVKTRDNYTCQICGLRDPEIMEVDHIKPKKRFPELALELENLVTLCPNCHRRKTNREWKTCRGL